jgi:hypothetical protein
MNQCACGCGGLTKKKWVSGHNAVYVAKMKRQAEGQLGASAPATVPTAPPSSLPYSAPAGDIATPPEWPAPIDRRKYRLAEERSGTDLRAPWTQVRCLECREPTWTRDPQSDICEECGWLLRERMLEEESKVMGTRSVRIIDPFTE